MLSTLDRTERLRLMKFVCSFAWADLEVHDEERQMVRRLVKKLALGPDETAQVERWLDVPPPPEEVDPAEIPREHRQLFIDTARQMVMADGRIDPEEAESLALLELLAR